MEEFESQTERVEEDLHHHAEHGAHAEPWVSGVALTAALLAALAATTALLSGHRANEAMVLQGKSQSDWAYYQAKSIKATMADDLREMLDKPLTPALQAKSDKYAADEARISTQARAEAAASEAYFARHKTLSLGVTLFQVAIAVSAISALTRRKAFWFVGIALGCVGVVFLALGAMPVKEPEGPPHEAPGGGAAAWVADVSPSRT